MSQKLSVLQNILHELNSSPDIEAAAVVRRDGILIAGSLPQEVDSKSVAAMTAAIVGTAEQSAMVLHRGAFRQVIIEAEEGKIVSIGIGPLALLSCLVRPSANLGLVLLQMNKTGEKMKLELSDES